MTFLMRCRGPRLAALVWLLVFPWAVSAEPGFWARDYSRIDEAARLVPKETLAQTARSLADLGKDDWEKARALYVWLCENVAYDTEEYYHPGPARVKSQANTPEAVFQSGKAVCAGYSSLYETLAKAMGLEVVTIAGRSKGTKYEVGHEIPVNHDWNAVRIDGQWRLMDTTWGAGSVNSEQEGFKKGFDAMWFDIPPVLALHWHLPVEARWALTDPVPSYEDYRRAVPPGQSAYGALSRMGVNLWAVAAVPPQSLPTSWQLTELTKNGLPLTAILSLAERGLTDDKTYGLVHLREGGFSADQSLAFFDHGLTSKRGRDWSRALTLGFSAEALLQTADLPLPTIYPSDGWTYRILEAPTTKQLTAGVPVRLRIAAPGFSRGGVSNGSLTRYPVTDGVLDLTFSPQAGPVSVSLEGLYNGKVSFWSILGYEAAVP